VRGRRIGLAGALVDPATAPLRGVNLEEHGAAIHASAEVTAMREEPSTCDWTVEVRRDLTVPTNW
jgi:hypothetical protein